ncbi:MAG TPA: TAXI family TRAP transporter solute-binding subunit, partial [Burkholderiales bacterium]|nr:TAXI family TRAP transporter solute-binding subunit [Burkholderiales bacterium]
ELLAREKIRVDLRTSSGSVENLKRLTDDDSGVEVAFVQGGVGDAEKQPGLVTLAALYYEPLWVFYRGAQELTLLSQLAGKKTAIGPEGSGTRVLALNLLTVSNANHDPARFSELSGMAAAQALIDGSVDAVILVAAPDAPVIQRLLRADGVRLMSLGHAEALARRFPYLATVALPRGVIDLADDIPSANITLVATTAYLVAREDFHPALVSVVLQAATRIHGGSGVFNNAGQFPAARDGDFPASEDAQRFFKSGPPFLQRYMPFWVANLVERLIVLLVPLLAIAIPLARVLPGVYDWRVRSRVFRWYGELKAVELEAAKNPSPRRIAELLEQLDAIQDGVDRTRVPLSHADYAFNLKGHIDLVRARLERKAPQAQDDAAGSA